MSAEENSVLADLRVVEIVKDNASALLCGRMLAELGADVMMVEPLQGHVLRRRGRRINGDATDAFEIATRGKRSVVLDIHNAKGSDRLVEAISGADVLLVDQGAYREIEGAKILERIGNAASLVTCCVSPYGLTGPYADIPGSELTVQALAGVLATNGEPGDGPLRAGIPVAGCGGAFYALIAILSALYERQHSGRGQLIDQSQYDAVIAFQGTLIPGYLLSGEEFQRIGNRHALTAPWNHYRTRDSWIVISTVGNEQWQRLAKLIGRPELADDEDFRDPVGRIRNVDELDATIEAWTTMRMSTDALVELARASVPASSILTLSEALSDEHARDRMVEVREGAAAPRLPFRLGHSSVWRWGEVPSLGSSDGQWSGPRFPAGSGSASSAEAGPLAGVKVVEMGVLTAGPLVGRILGMLGAEVLKIESPRGERTRKVGHQIAGNSYLYYLNNTDKDGCTLDLDAPDGRVMLRELCASADVFLTNLGAETLASVGASFDALSAVNNRLVYGMTSGYGLTGGGRNRKAFDTTIQASTGIMSLTGTPDGHPLKVALSIVDLLSALNTAAGIVAGLVARKRYGYGQIVDACLMDAGLWSTQDYWPALFRTGEVPRRYGNRHPHLAPHNCFRAADGWIALSIESDDQWNAWLNLAGQGALAGDRRYAETAGRLAHVTEVEALVSSWVEHQAVRDVVARCAAAGVPAAAVSKLSEAIEHPLTRERDMILTQSKRSTGPIRIIGAPIKMSRSQVAVRRMAPDLGEHNGKLPRPKEAVAG